LKRPEVVVEAVRRAPDEPAEIHGRRGSASGEQVEEFLPDGGGEGPQLAPVRDQATRTRRHGENCV
jgi:hypothetical protein